MKKIAKNIGSLALYLATACVPTPKIVSYNPHMPVETQRQIAENTLHELLPKICSSYVFRSPAAIRCEQNISYQSHEHHANYDLSCPEIEAIAVLEWDDAFSVSGRYLFVLKGQCTSEPIAVLDDNLRSNLYGKCRAIIRPPFSGYYGGEVHRDFYEAIYAYCTSHSYPIQIYGDPKGLFGR